MTVLIVEGRTHQFVTTDDWVRLCYATSLATGFSTPIICCFHHAKCSHLKKHSAVPTHYLQQPGLLCHSPRLLCLHWRELHELLETQGKVRPPKKLERDPRFHKAFRHMGDDWNVKAHVMQQLEQFAYLVYRQFSKFYVSAVHVKLPHNMVGEDKKLISKSGVDLSRLTHSSLLWSHTSSI